MEVVEVRYFVIMVYMSKYVYVIGNWVVNICCLWCFVFVILNRFSDYIVKIFINWVFYFMVFKMNICIKCKVIVEFILSCCVKCIGVCIICWIDIVVKVIIINICIIFEIV